MGLLKRLTSMFSPSPREEDRAYWLFVQCSRCNEKIKSRVDLFNDLSPIYNEAGVTYFCRKVLVGQGRCYQKVEVELAFDEGRKLTSKEIKWGRFISQEEFEQDQASG